MAAYRRYKATGLRTKGKAGRRTWAARKLSKRYAASPAGRHRRMATLLFGIAKKARSIGNGRHARAMRGLAKRALALSKAEYRMWKMGQALRTRSLATHRALRAW